jgi:hypothetical protein
MNSLNSLHKLYGLELQFLELTIEFFKKGLVGLFKGKTGFSPESGMEHLIGAIGEKGFEVLAEGVLLETLPTVVGSAPAPVVALATGFAVLMTLAWNTILKSIEYEYRLKDGAIDYDEFHKQYVKACDLLMARMIGFVESLMASMGKRYGDQSTELT